MAKKENKTNAMRILEKMNIPFTHQEYECDEFTDGSDIATKLSLPHEQVFKTLVTEGNDKQHYVFVIPVDRELDLKACARSVKVKSVQMTHMKDLFAITGYVRGGCTAVGMKKRFVTRIDESAKAFENIYVSGGRIGVQLSLSPDDLCKASDAEYAPLTQ